MTMLYVVIACGLLSIVYAIWATQSVLAADQGNAQAQDALSAMYSRDEIVRTPTPATISAPHTRMLKPTRLKRYSPRLRTMAHKQARVCAGRGGAGRGGG